MSVKYRRVGTSQIKSQGQVKDIGAIWLIFYASETKCRVMRLHRDSSFMQAELSRHSFKKTRPIKAKQRKMWSATDGIAQSDGSIGVAMGSGKTEAAIRAALRPFARENRLPFWCRQLSLPCNMHARSQNGYPLPSESGLRVAIQNHEGNQGFRIQPSKGRWISSSARIALWNKDVEFKNLGLLIIDEEQKFAKVKDRLKELKVNGCAHANGNANSTHITFLTHGREGLEHHRTPPPNRATCNHRVAHVQRRNYPRCGLPMNWSVAGGCSLHIIAERYWLHRQYHFYKLVPDSSALAGTRPDGRRLEKSDDAFYWGEYVWINIIESGLDIRNAKSPYQPYAYVLAGERFGNQMAAWSFQICYLHTTRQSFDGPMRANGFPLWRNFSELGDGFKVAMRDLDIRGCGKFLLGAEQSGFINDLGYETYHKILDDAVQELKEEEFKDLFLHLN